MRKNTFEALVIGLCVGYIAGLLTAPRSGKETLKYVKDQADIAKKSLDDKTQNLKYDIDSIKETVTDTVGLYTGKDIRPIDGQSVFVKEF